MRTLFVVFAISLFAASCTHNHFCWPGNYENGMMKNTLSCERINH